MQAGTGLSLFVQVRHAPFIASSLAMQSMELQQRNRSQHRCTNNMGHLFAPTLDDWKGSRKLRSLSFYRFLLHTKFFQVQLVLSVGVSKLN
mmetsp:Transcript_45895/g.139383  ORF Transcript_45895/g.139383 Transcript_45895/m.139383 type:complete len:91 (-) Transcript_45895:78-350(-)